MVVGVEGYGQLPDDQVVEVIEAALGALAERSPSGSDEELLALLDVSLRAQARLHAWVARLAERVDASDAAWRAHGTSLSTWLAEVVRLTHREASRLVSTGRQLQRFDVVGAAAASGEVTPAQADAITGVLAKLPETLSAERVRQAESLMVEFAADHNSTELRRLNGRLLELVAPEVAEESEAVRLERERQLALRTRYLAFVPDHQGSILIRGSLPVAEAAPFMKIVDAYAAAEPRGEVRAPDAPRVTPGMRRADGLMAMVDAHQQDQRAPRHGGDRPRAVVMVQHEAMLASARDVAPLRGMLDTGDEIAPSALRQVLCDCEVLPVVMRGESEVLDQGRAERLVSPEIRVALAARDRGCVFPGCEKAPAACQAHHIVPWWAHGPTSLDNLVLLCPHHHGIVEPSHDPWADRWRVRLPRGRPAEILPPRSVDAAQRPRVHVRFRRAR